MTYEEFEKRYQYDPQRDFLARGGFGAVYKAYDTVRKRYVAIKESDVDPSHKFSLLREVELSHEIEPHDNVVRYINNYRFTLGRKDTDYAVMPYFEKGNLNQVIAQYALGDADRMAIARGLLAGVAHLHRQGVIHRDLKASNILLEQREGDWIPKLTDFGVSKLADTGVSVSNTQIGLSIHYAAPEQLRNETILPNVDLWAVGVSLYKVVMGRLPFDPDQGKTDAPTPNREFDMTAVAVLINQGLTPEQAVQIPYPYRTVIEQCLIVDKHQRPKTAGELLALLSSPEPVAVPATIPAALPPPLPPAAVPPPPVFFPPLPVVVLPAQQAPPEQLFERPTSIQTLSPSEPVVEEVSQARLSVRRLTTNASGITATLNLTGATRFPLQINGLFSTLIGVPVGQIDSQPVGQNGEIQVEADYPAAVGAGQVQFRLVLPPAGTGAAPMAPHILVETDWYDWQHPQQQTAVPQPVMPVSDLLSGNTSPTLRPQRGQPLSEAIRSRLWVIALVALVVVTAMSYYLTRAEPENAQMKGGLTATVAEPTPEVPPAEGPYVNGVAPVTSPDGRKRYRTAQGQLFDEVRAAHCGRIPVRLGNLWGYLNLNGELAINLNYDDAQAFDEGTCRALVTANGDVFRVDRWGTVLK